MLYFVLIISCLQDIHASNFAKANNWTGLINASYLCYCSGGYNIKTGPGCSIELMKFDMGGAAAAFGAAKAIGLIKPPGVEVTVLSFFSQT